MMGRKARSLVILGRDGGFNLLQDPYTAELKANTQLQVHTQCRG